MSDMNIGQAVPQKPASTEQTNKPADNAVLRYAGPADPKKESNDTFVPQTPVSEEPVKADPGDKFVERYAGPQKPQQ